VGLAVRSAWLREERCSAEGISDSLRFGLVPVGVRRCSEIDNLVRGEARDDRRDRSVALVLLFMVVDDAAGETADTDSEVAGTVRGGRGDEGERDGGRELRSGGIPWAGEVVGRAREER
jgi:hypothetical protein